MRQARLPFRKLRRQRQNRRNIRAVVHVQRRTVQLVRLHADVVVALLHRCAQRHQVAENRAVALRRHGRQMRDGDIMPQRTRAAQHSRLRIIAVQVARVAFVLLMTGNPPAERVAFLHLDAAGGNGLDGHADVALTFHRLLHRQRRIARQQRQRKQQPRYKLAGHVARQHIVARLHFAAHGQFCRAVRAHAHIPAHPARHKQIAVHVHRA